MSMPAEQFSTRPNLRELLDGIAHAPAVSLAGLTDDSRRIVPGGLFLACQGGTAHGLEFADTAIREGAAAIAWDETTGDASLARGDVPFVAVPALANRLGDLANRWYDAPSSALDVIGVTGTNGKTTVAWLTARALTALGAPTGYLGTLGHGIGRLEVDSGLTTPPAIELHGRLAGFRDRDAHAAAIEVSSHGLAQGRVQGVSFDAALFTNLSRDHVDYHGSMEAYGAAKASLLRGYPCRRRIVCVDTPFGRELAIDLAAEFGDRVIVTTSQADEPPTGARIVRAAACKATAEGTRVQLVTSWGEGGFELPLPGAFNVDNALLVIALLLDRGVPLQTACQTMASLTAPPGRLQRIAGPGGGPQVYVDYAHTPAALEAVLRALRPHATGRIWCVFGCGGDRDRGKRPLMGRIVSRLADRAVITSDNPRSEAPGAIIADIQAAMTSDAFAIEDRRDAIRWTIAEAADGDTVLIAGKGHEDYQIIGDTRLDFSDYEVAAECLHERGAPRPGADK